MAMLPLLPMLFICENLECGRFVPQNFILWLISRRKEGIRHQPISVLSPSNAIDLISRGVKHWIHLPNFGILIL